MQENPLSQEKGAQRSEEQQLLLEKDLRQGLFDLGVGIGMQGKGEKDGFDKMNGAMKGIESLKQRFSTTNEELEQLCFQIEKSLKDKLTRMLRKEHEEWKKIPEENRQYGNILRSEESGALEKELERIKVAIASLDLQRN
jgi:hypothetical protein